MTNDIDVVDFDEAVTLALAEAAEGHAPRADELWLPHPVPGIKMRVLALNKKRGYAT